MPRTDRNGFPPPRKSWGQHFLTNAHLAQQIAAAVPAAPGETILEIGPGRGALTRHLLAREGPLIVVEFDPLLAAHWQRQAGVECVAGDILQVGPALFTARGPLHLVGNLPYNLSSPILALLAQHAAPLRSLTIMLQREFAQRLLAPPGTGDYSALSVVAQNVWHWTKLCAVEPGAFTPPPKVDSLVLTAVPRPALAPDVLRRLTAIARAVFHARRKMLSNTLPSACGGDRARAQALLAEAGISPDTRPERVPPEVFLRWAEATVR